MGTRNTLRRCAIVGALALAGVSGVSAQKGFTVNGRVKVDGGGMDGVRVVVYKNGDKQRVLTESVSKFSLDLDLNSNYILSFEKDGFVTKKLNFDTHAPSEAIANGFTPFEFAVSLFKQYDGVNTVVFNQPVGMIRYEKTSDDFNYDTDYTKSIQSALENTMAEVAKKQTADKDKDDKAVKEKEKQDKERLRAEAEKQKQANELSKQQAKQQQTLADAARKEQERKDAEAKKQAQQQKDAEAKRIADEKKKAVPEKKPDPPKVAEKPKPAPPVAKEEKPKTKPAPRMAAANKLHGDPRSGADERRTIKPNEGNEASPVKPAKLNELSEARPKFEEPPTRIDRQEELITDKNQVVMVIKLSDGTKSTEYRKVVRKYSGTYFFKDGLPCSQLVFDSEALADNK